MNLNLDVTLDYQSPKFQDFLFQEKLTSYVIEPTLDGEFSNIPSDRRSNEESAKDDIIFFVKEKWGLYQDTSLKGVNNIIVVYKQEFSIGLKNWLSFKSNVDEAFKNECRTLFNNYNFSQHGEDIQKYINDNLATGFDQNAFSIDTEVLIEKIGDRIEFNTQQRDALFKLYDGSLSSRIDLLSDSGMGTWTRDTNVTLRRILPDELEIKSAPATSAEIREVQPGTADQSADAILTEILREIVPGDCGEMKEKQIKLLSLYEWPEFKIEWRKKRIKIGCSKITITYPVLQIRISKLNFYIYFSIPKNSGDTLFKIAETCAIRSALGAAVIGVVVGNPAAAIASFNALFKACIENEIKRCVNPGILLLKESGNWH